MLQDVSGREHRHDTTGQYRAQLAPMQWLFVRLRTDVVHVTAHQPIVDQAQQQADRADRKGDVPTQAVAVVFIDVVLQPWGQQLRDHRAQVDGHVVDGKGAVDPGVITLVDLAHQVAGIGLEQAVADHDDTQRTKHEPDTLARHHHKAVTDGQDHTAE